MTVNFSAEEAFLRCIVFALLALVVLVAARLFYLDPMLRKKRLQDDALTLAHAMNLRQAAAMLKHHDQHVYTLMIGAAHHLEELTQTD